MSRACFHCPKPELWQGEGMGKFMNGSSLLVSESAAAQHDNEKQVALLH